MPRGFVFNEGLNNHGNFLVELLGVYSMSHLIEMLLCIAKLLCTTMCTLLEDLIVNIFCLLIQTLFSHIVTSLSLKRDVPTFLSYLIFIMVRTFFHQMVIYILLCLLDRSKLLFFLFLIRNAVSSLLLVYIFYFVFLNFG